MVGTEIRMSGIKGRVITTKWRRKRKYAVINMDGKLMEYPLAKLKRSKGRIAKVVR
jgi:hypothetical protein